MASPSYERDGWCPGRVPRRGLAASLALGRTVLAAVNCACRQESTHQQGASIGRKRIGSNWHRICNFFGGTGGIMTNRYRLGRLVPLFALSSALLVGSARADEPQGLSDAATRAPARVDEPQRLPVATVGATTGSISPQSLRLAEMTVLSRPDRDVKLRLTLGPVSRPTFQEPAGVLDRDPSRSSFATITVNLVDVFRRR
jgi:hypothetical protein